jgi:hypothetical protein
VSGVASQMQIFGARVVFIARRQEGDAAVAGCRRHLQGKGECRGQCRLEHMPAAACLSRSRSGAAASAGDGQQSECEDPAEDAESAAVAGCLSLIRSRSGAAASAADGQLSECEDPGGDAESAVAGWLSLRVSRSGAASAADDEAAEAAEAAVARCLSRSRSGADPAADGRLRPRN